jgi:rfaE bifunctional protein nucleotidyltransferase chain/domain
MSFHSQLRDKITTREEALRRITEMRHGKKIVFTNGCFDILHPGHVDYLARARDLGDVLVLGLNTDDSVKKLEKAPGRPVNGQNARALVIAALASVDLIVLFDEQTPLQLITFLAPDILVKGDDYAPEQIVGADLVRAKGGQVITVPILRGYSTTALLNKIRS